MTDEPSLTMLPTPELVATVRAILAHPGGFDWKINGLGFIRCDLDGDDYCLNVWDRRLCTIDRAVIHTHPWDLESLVLSGAVRNRQFHVGDNSLHIHTNPHLATHYGVHIHTRPWDLDDAIADQKPALYELGKRETAVWSTDEGYRLARGEAHATDYLAGTVTLVRRTNRDPSRRVGIWWPKDDGDVWNDPSTQTLDEDGIWNTCQLALATWREVTNFGDWQA